MELMAFCVISKLISPKIWASNFYSLRTLLTGSQLDFNNHLHAQFGTYAKTQEDLDPSNTIEPFTAPSIYLGIMGCLQE